MILSPSYLPDLMGLSDDIFPLLPATAPDQSKDAEDSARRVAARKAIEELELASHAHTQGGPDVEIQFSDKHPVFGAHLTTRTINAPANAVIVGVVHKYPTLNILTKGKIVIASEHGKRVLEAPCMYMQAANVKKVGWVLEDCSFTNVFMMPEALPDSEADAAQRAFHTVGSYAALEGGGQQCLS